MRAILLVLFNLCALPAFCEYYTFDLTMQQSTAAQASGFQYQPYSVGTGDLIYVNAYFPNTVIGPSAYRPSATIDVAPGLTVALTPVFFSDPFGDHVLHYNWTVDGNLLTNVNTLDLSGPDSAGDMTEIGEYALYNCGSYNSYTCNGTYGPFSATVLVQATPEPSESGLVAICIGTMIVSRWRRLRQSKLV